MDSRRQARARRRARLPIALGALGLLLALTFAVGQASAFRNPLATIEERPSFVVIQTDDQTLDGLYAAYKPPEGRRPTRAMPNTLDMIAKRGMTFNRYYVSYPLCCPSRVSLLTGRYAHNHGVKGNIQPDGGYTGFAQRAAFTHNLAVWLQNSGYRTIHVGKFLNGYGDEPYDDGKTVPPGWSAWHTVLNADTDHYYYGYTENNNGTIEGPYGDSGSWETREYGARDDIGCPFAPTNGLPCYYETDHFTQLATEEISETPPGQPFYLQLDYTAPHGDFRRPAGPEPAPRNYDWFKGARLPHDRRKASTRATSRQAPLHPRSRTPDPQRQAHLPRLLAEAAREPALGRRRRQRDHRHPGRPHRCATRTSSSPPTTASSSASTGCSAASSSPTSPPPTCPS